MMLVIHTLVSLFYKLRVREVKGLALRHTQLVPEANHHIPEENMLIQ